MNIENIAFTTEFNLCSGCGICVGTCPKQCIQWRKNDNGMYQPFVNSNVCINCGLCKEVCPGLGHQYGEKLDWEAVQGEVLQACNGVGHLKYDMCLHQVELYPLLFSIY